MLVLDSADAGGGVGPVDTWELVYDAQSGVTEAFASLYRAYVDAIFGYLIVRTGDRSMAEELTSETFLRAFRQIGSVRYLGSPFRAWLLRIARNLLLDDLKSARRRHEVSLPDHYDRASESGDPAVSVCSRVTSVELRRGMKQLTDNQRVCLELRFFEHLSVSEVARRMGRTDGAIKALQLRATRSLAGLLSPELVDR